MHPFIRPCLSALALSVALGLTSVTSPVTTSTSAAAAAPSSSAGPKAAGHSLRSGLTDQNFYFVMGDRFANGDTGNDEGGLSGDRNTTGFDPTSKAFYNGGDLDGLRSKLDYIKGLGTDAIWLTPVFKNKAVQLEDGPSAGYHGYWITDFTQVDPHLGTNDDLRRAHRRRARPRDEGVLRHHHQPHRRRDRLRRGRPDGVRLEGRRALPPGRRERLRRPRLRGHVELPRRSTRRPPSRTPRCSTRPRRTSRSRPGSTT